MALDTRGAVDGFIKGFTFVDGYMDKEEDRKRRDVMDAENREYRESQLNRQAEQDALQRERFEANREWREQRAEQADKQWAQSNRRAEQQNARQQAEFERKQKELMAQDIFATVKAGGDLTDEQEAFIKKNPVFDPWRFLDDEMQSAIKYFERAAESAEFDSDDDFIRFANTPQTLGAFNKLFKHQIQKGGGGSDKKISGIMPGPEEGTLVFELEVTGEDGQVRREPMTVKRGQAGEDDEVKVVSIEDVTQQIAGMSIFNRQLRDLPKDARNKFISYGVQRGSTQQVGSPVERWQVGNDKGRKMLYAIDANGNKIKSIDVGEQGGLDNAKYTWGPLKEIPLEVTPVGSDEPITLESVQTHQNGAVRGFATDGRVLTLEGSDWVVGGQGDSERKPSDNRQQQRKVASGGAGVSEETVTQTVAMLRKNPNNAKYSDEQLREAVIAKLSQSSQ